MPKNEQGFSLNRYTVIPRTLIFITAGEKVLLLKGAEGKKLWSNKLNGIGGHVEGGENMAACARRELLEEAGLEGIPLVFCGNVLVDSGEGKGISIFIFKGQYNGQPLKSSAEGELMWVYRNKIRDLPVVEDLPCLLERVLQPEIEKNPFFARSFYEGDALRVDFDQSQSL